MLDIPDGMGDYDAWQRLEAILGSGAGSPEMRSLEDGVEIYDFFLARCVGERDQKTSHYEMFLKEVSE